MAVLNATQRQDAASRFIQHYFVSLAQTADLDSAEVQTMVNDLDTWLDANQGAANNAITAAVRAKASTSTKFAALAYVSMKRGGLI